jgi:hypothetical protein
VDAERLFAVTEDREPPQHYALLLRACGLNYGEMPTSQRRRVGALARRLIANGIPERRIAEEGARIMVALGRPATISEIADRLLR